MSNAGDVLRVRRKKHPLFYSCPIQPYRAGTAVFVEDKIEVALGMDLPVVPIPVEPERRGQEFSGKVTDSES